MKFAIDSPSPFSNRRNNRSLGTRGDDVTGFLTLEQFMLQRQEEERQQNQDRFREREQDRDRDPATPSHRETSEGECEHVCPHS